MKKGRKRWEAIAPPKSANTKRGKKKQGGGGVGGRFQKNVPT